MEERSSGREEEIKKEDREREREEKKRKRKGESTSPPRFSSLSRTLPSKELRLNA